MTFAEALAMARRREGLSQLALGAHAGVAASHLNRLEHGYRTATGPAFVAALVGVLGDEYAPLLYWTAGLLPPAWRRLHPGDPTLSAVATFLCVPLRDAGELQDFRSVVEAMVLHWGSAPAVPVEQLGQAALPL